jgi:putative aldouronate transport system permease protein
MPFVIVAAQSLSSEEYIYRGEVTFFPKGFTLKTYQVLIAEKYFLLGYWNTIKYTIIGTLISLFLTTMLAYALSKKNIRGRTFFLGFTVFTLFFSGGLIPTYILIKSLGMKNTIWAVIIPGAISTFNMIVMKSFFEQLPAELEEAAMMDGAGTFRIIISIIIPLSKPILATMFLFYAVGNWNNWFGPFLYLENKEMHPITLYLRNIVQGAQQSAGTTGDEMAQIAATIRSAAIMLTSIPIMSVYPMIQKHFIRGVMIGAIKG